MFVNMGWCRSKYVCSMCLVKHVLNVTSQREVGFPGLQ